MDTSNQQQIKAVNLDTRSRKRVRFLSSKQRAKSVSADIYRTYNRPTVGSVSSSATRERLVHSQQQTEDEPVTKKLKVDHHHHAITTTEKDESQDLFLSISTTFASELDLTKERNSSQLFAQFFKEMSPLVHSLPEILHHLSDIVSILLRYVVSSSTDSSSPSPPDTFTLQNRKGRGDGSTILFVTNLVTTNVLHLLAVLARDVKGDIHPYLFQSILPRIVYDLIQPPSTHLLNGQGVTLNVTMVEAAFRCLSYLFKYDAMIQDKECMDTLRQFYGPTLGHSLDYVRRLAAETFAPWIRKVLVSDAARTKHVRKVVQALCISSYNSTTSTTRRLPQDAIHGVALLLFYLCKGVEGTLHSKTSKGILAFVLDYLLGSGSHPVGEEEEKETQQPMTERMQQDIQIYVAIASQFFHHVQGHLKCLTPFQPVWDNLVESTRTMAHRISNTTHHSQLLFHGFQNKLAIFHQSILYNHGALIRMPSSSSSSSSETSIPWIYSILSCLLDAQLYFTVPPSTQQQILTLVASIWKIFSQDMTLSLHLCTLFPCILVVVSAENENPVDSTRFLIDELLPSLPHKLGMKYLVPILLSSIAKRISHDTTTSMDGSSSPPPWKLLYSMVSLYDKEEDCSDPAQNRAYPRSYNLFCAFMAPDCEIAMDDKEKLIQSILGDSNRTLDSLDQLGYYARILPFLAHVQPQDTNDSIQQQNERIITDILSWYTRCIQSVWDDSQIRISSHLKDDSYKKSLITSLLLGGLSATVSECIHPSRQNLVSSKVNKKIKKSLETTSSMACSVLVTNSSSPITVVCIAEYAQILSNFSLYMSNSPDQVFESLTLNLRSPNPLLRKFSLSILNSFPKKPYITDFADLEVQGELDDEHDFSRSKNEDGIQKTQTHGLCDLIETLVQIESLSPSLDNERQFLSAISRVEVLGRSGRLPIQYAEVAIHHMFGILHVKFQPIWSAAVRAIVALITAQEKVVWPCVEWMLVDTMNPEGSIVSEIHGSHVSIDEHFKFPYMQYTSTDKDTLFDTIWSVTHKIPIVITRKARIVVPIFITFLSQQYFVYYDDDPDSREIDWSQYMNSSLTTFYWEKDQLTSKNIQKKLISFLNMFRELKGMIHLFQSDLLLFIFTSLLSNPDVAIAKLSFECIVKYKLPFVNPYTDSLRHMLTKSELRETLTKLNADTTDHDFVERSHREQFFPVIIRLLFGRLIARGSSSRSKSSNSADARRSAILSFIAMISKNNDEGDFNYFIYLMIRAFIPKSVDMTLADVGHANHERIGSLIKSCLEIDAKAIATIPTPRLEGFLNLLSTIIKQCALSIQGFVDVFLFVCLKIIQYTEMHRIDSAHDLSSENDCVRLGSQDPNRTKIGLLRNSCFRRIQELLDRFKITSDIEQHVDVLWVNLKPAILTLPGMVVNAVNPPSILKLLVSCTMHPVLVRSLHRHCEIVRCVILCISITSTSTIMDCVLRILENLLSECGNLSMEETSGMNDLDPTGGIRLVQNYIPLLLNQFAERLRQTDRGNENAGRKSRNNRDNAFADKELIILRRISELLSIQGDYDESSRDTLDTLCRVLVSHIQSDPRNQTDVVNILVSFAPRVNTHTTSFLFTALAKLLGPHKTRPGLTDKVGRFDIVRVIEAMSQRDDASPALKGVTLSLHGISAMSKRNVDEFDFDQVLPVINNLGHDAGSGSWSAILEGQVRVGSTIEGPSIILPLLYTCLHLLYDSDGVITRACLQALKTLIKFLSHGSQEYIEFSKTILVPCIRTGLKTDHQGARKSFIQLIYEISRNFSGYPSPHFYGDLNVLINENEPDLDFFFNLVHVQIHRRTRAFARLRKILPVQDEPAQGDEQSKCPLSTTSLVHILLPLLMHPIYESSSKEDENLALEAISTIGVIATRLPLGKFQRLLWSTILQINRNPSKERYLVTLLCHLIDAFHFHVDQSLWDHGTQIEARGQSETNPNARSELTILKKKIIPKIEAKLVKQSTTGSKGSSTLRCQLLISLMKLFAKISERTLELKFPHLLGLLCDALKNRESDERDQARVALAKLAVGLDMKYIPIILRGLAITLTEGYQLHVRAACLHTILVSLAEAHRSSASSNTIGVHFDNSLPAMMDILLSDLFGQASEMKEVEGVKRRVIKEAMGNKSYSSLQILSELVSFQPSRTLDIKGVVDTHQLSSIQVIVQPFLEKLRDPESKKSTVGKAHECLSRIILGLSKNLSVSLDELLPFVKATITPLFPESHYSCDDDDDEDGISSGDDSEIGNEIIISSTVPRTKQPKISSSKRIEAVFNWNPSSLKSANNKKEAIGIKVKEQGYLRQVKDGTNAPKLTGSNRHGIIKMNASSCFNPAAAAAINFALTLMHAILKKTNVRGYEKMIDPFAALLAKTLTSSGDKSIILSSLKNFIVLLRLNLPSIPLLSKRLGTFLFELVAGCNMTTNSTSSSEISQMALKTLALLITTDRVALVNDLDDEKYWEGDEQRTKEPLRNEFALPLSKAQMQILISFLHRSVDESDRYQHGSLVLIKAITSRKYLSPEYYDMIESILKLSVQSHSPAVRQRCCRIFLQYLIDYPMGNERLQQHLKQIVLNIKYSYEEGRLSAVELLTATVQKLPLPLVEEYSQLFFLPLVLQLSNDDSKLCREAVAISLGVLLKRLSLQLLHALYVYCTQWMIDDRLRRAATQVLGLFVENRPDFFQKESIGIEVVVSLRNALIKDGQDGMPAWEKCYLSLQTLEKMNSSLLSILQQDMELWQVILKCLIHPHPWVQEVSSRIVSSHFQALNPRKLENYKSQDNNTSRKGSNEPRAISFIFKLPGALFEAARNFCFQISTKEENLSDEVLRLAIKNLTWVIVAMHYSPQLCFKDDQEEVIPDDPSGRDAEGEYDNSADGDGLDYEHSQAVAGGTERKRDPVNWLITRLSCITKGARCGAKSREVVYKCFGSFAVACESDILSPVLKKILEALLSSPDTEAELAKEVLQLLESKCESAVYLEAYTSVQNQLRVKRQGRKDIRRVEAVVNPQSAAKRKIEKQQRERSRQKRRYK